MDSIFPPNPKEGDRLEISSKGLIYRNGQWNLEVLIPLLTDTNPDIPNPEAPGDSDDAPEPTKPPATIDLPSTNVKHWLDTLSSPPATRYTYSKDGGTYRQTLSIPDGKLGTETYVLGDEFIFKAGKKSSTTLELPAPPTHTVVSSTLRTNHPRDNPISEIIVLTETTVFAKISGGDWKTAPTPQNAKFVTTEGRDGSVNVVCTDKVVRVMEFDRRSKLLTPITPVELTGEVHTLSKIVSMVNRGIFINNDGSLGEVLIDTRSDEFTTRLHLTNSIIEINNEVKLYAAMRSFCVDKENTLYKVLPPNTDLEQLGTYTGTTLVGVLGGAPIDVNGLVFPIACYFSNGVIAVGADDNSGFVKYQYPLAEGERIIDATLGNIHTTSSMLNGMPHVVMVDGPEGVRIEEFQAVFSEAPIANAGDFL